MAPAVTETEFAQRSFDLDDFNYNGAVPRFHTAKQMAGFMLDLFESDKAAGIVTYV